MLNFKYRSYVRQRPKFYKQFKARRISGLRREIKGSGMSRKSVNETRGSVFNVRNGNLRTRASKRSYEDVGYLENFLRKHQQLVKFGTKTADWLWDHGGRNIVSEPLKRRRRGQLRGGTNYEEI